MGAGSFEFARASLGVNLDTKLVALVDEFSDLERVCGQQLSLA